jgi:hypothetical protein
MKSTHKKFIGVPLFYCSSAFPGLCLSCAETDYTDYINNNTFAVQTKKKHNHKTLESKTT